MNTPVKKITVVDVEHAGSKIQLPIIEGAPLSYDAAIDAIARKKEAENQVMNLHQMIECSPLDGAIAFHRALTEKFGWVDGVSTKSLFGDIPPTMVSVDISPTEKMQIVWGKLQIPGIEGNFSLGLTTEPKPAFVITGSVRKKHETQVNEIVALTRKYLKEQSIYKGQAIKVNFGWGREGRSYDPLNDCPKFMDLSSSEDSTLVFSEKVMNALTVGLFTSIEHKEACREHKVPLKRGVLLYGPYGTGKTLTAYITALKAIKHGWTFIYLQDVRDIKEALDFATQYAPAVVFAEDIDRVVTGDRSVSMDQILNTLDGVDTKGGEILTVFTTNHIEEINPALLRMGRLDALIEVLPPDEKAAIQLVTLYGRGLLEEGIDLTKIGHRLAGKIPAFIREATERAKIAAIARTQGGNIKGHVTESDLLQAADFMEAHNAFLNTKKGKGKSKAQLLFTVPGDHPKAGAFLESFGSDEGESIEQ